MVNARRVWKKEDKTNSVSQFLIYASVSHPTPLFPSRAPSSPPSLPPRSSLILYGSMKRLLSVGRNSEVWGVGWRSFKGSVLYYYGEYDNHRRVGKRGGCFNIESPRPLH